jgi:signal peptidase II
MQRKWWVFFSVALVAVSVDALAKRWAATTLPPGATMHPWGQWLPLTLGYNRGIAFGLNVGGASRIVFAIVAVAVLPVVVLLYRATPAAERLRQVALSLMFAGALGNLIDRVGSTRGVVDFIGPYDLGFMKWPVFNVADMCVVVGTLAFALTVGHGGHAAASPPAPGDTAAGGPA